MLPRLRRERNKKVAIKHGFEGVREHILPWHCLRVVRIGFPSWRTVPPLCSSCLARLEALGNSVRLNFCMAVELSDANGQYGQSIQLPWPSH
jgi:hypothetical protein